MAVAIAISQSFRRLFLHPAHALLNIIELRSFFFGVVCFAVLLILAYLTNPSEASFRTFLTEQSFRRHLTKLTDADKDSDSIAEAKRYTLPSHDPHPATTRSLPASYAYHDHVASNQPMRFHFANRVAISLQTPSHIFRSFGLFTAVVTPLVDTSSHGTYQSPEDNGKPSPWSPDGKIRGSWFIGAFGKWWIGGTIELSKRDIETLTAHESLLFKAALCNVRTMDYGDAYEGLRTALVPQMKVKKPKSKSSRSIEPEPSIKQTATPLPSRSGTPPPLGKHANRRSQKAGPNAPPMQKTHSGSISNLITSPSHAIENTPIITDAMKQISDAQSAVLDLRSQLQLFQSNAFASHATLQATLDEHKARKRLEDSARADLKSRTKVLEDNKRQAETGKRDAEKKLKAAHAARDSATNRIQRLGRDIDALKKRITRDEGRTLKSHTNATALDANIAQELIQKRSDLKATEDEVSQLSARARELEQLVGQERVRLQSLQEETALHRSQNPQYHPSPQQGELVESWAAPDDSFEWPMPAIQPSRRNLSQPMAPPPELREVFNSPMVRRSHALSLGRLPDAMIPTPTTGTPGAGNYAGDASTRVIAPFSPFNAEEPPERRSNPPSASLLPTNLVNSIDNESPSDLEAFHLISPVISSFDFSHLSVETPHTPLNFPTCWGAPSASILYESSQNEPSMATNPSVSSTRPSVETFLPPRSWPPKPQPSSTRVPQKSGLNPDAPIFQPPSHRLQSLRSSVPPPDNVIPHAEAPATASTKPPRFTSLSAARAFAPSPEEREALQRAFGGTQNGSLERLSMGMESLGEHGGLLSRLPISPFVLPPDAHLMDEVEWGLNSTRKGQGTAE